VGEIVGLVLGNTISGTVLEIKGSREGAGNGVCLGIAVCTMIGSGVGCDNCVKEGIRRRDCDGERSGCLLGIKSGEMDTRRLEFDTFSDDGGTEIGDVRLVAVKGDDCGALEKDDRVGNFVGRDVNGNDGSVIFLVGRIEKEDG
jgi:hypothetical protein